MIVFLIATVIQAAESSIENAPLVKEISAGSTRVVEKLEAQLAQAKQQSNELDADIAALKGKRGVGTFFKVLLFKKSPPKNKLDALNNAIYKGDSRLVTKLLAKRPPVNHLCSNGDTLLHNAINPASLCPEYKAGINLDLGRVQASMACTQLLLESSSIAVNAQNTLEESTALNLLIRSAYFYLTDCVPVVTKLLRNGADPYINNIYQENVYTILKAKIADKDKHRVVRDTLRACVAQRNVVLVAIKKHLINDASGIVILYAWGNLHNLLQEVELLYPALANPTLL